MDVRRIDNLLLGQAAGLSAVREVDQVFRAQLFEYAGRVQSGYFLYLGQFVLVLHEFRDDVHVLHYAAVGRLLIRPFLRGVYVEVVFLLIFKGNLGGVDIVENEKFVLEARQELGQHHTAGLAHEQL